MSDSQARNNARIQAISWLVRGTKEYSPGETFACQGCGTAYDPEVIELAHRDPVRKVRSGGFQAQQFGEQLLGMPLGKARRAARALCANCHKIETARQRSAGWSGGRDW